MGTKIYIGSMAAAGLLVVATAYGDQLGIGGYNGIMELIHNGSAITQAGDITLNDDVQLEFGTSGDTKFEYDTAITPDATVGGLGSDSRILYICEAADINTDWAKAQQTNPTVCIQSADAATTTDRICFAHDQTDGVITTDGGNLVLNSAGNTVQLATGETLDANTNIIANIGNTGTDFVATTGALTLAGVLSAGAGSESTAAGTCVGADSVLADNNGYVGCPKLTNVAPQGLMLRAQPAFPGGTQTAAKVVHCGGQDETTITIDDYTLCEDDTVTITVINSNGTSTETILTESELGGNDWNAVTSNNQTATNLAAQLNDGTPDGVTATASSAVVRIVLDADTCLVTLAESDATCTTVAVGTAAVNEFHRDISMVGTDTQIVFAVDNDAVTPSITCEPGTGFYASADNVLSVAVNGAEEMQFTSNGVTGVTAASGIVMNELAGGTNPTLVPANNDLDTGIGSSVTDGVSIVAGGIEALLIREGVAVAGSVRATLAGASSTDGTFLTVSNSSNAAAASHAYVDIAVGGTTSTGDPQVRWTVPGGTSWYAGSDNSVNDEWVVGIGSAVGTTPSFRLDPRLTTAGVISVRFQPVDDYTIASGAGNVITGIQLGNRAINYTGITQVTTLLPYVDFPASTIAGDTATLTVDKATTAQLTAPIEGTNVTLTDTSAIRVLNTTGSPTNQHGVYIEDMTSGGSDYGITIAGSDTACIWVSSAADTTDAANGISFGLSKDTNLYRGAANELTTDDSIKTGGIISQDSVPTVTLGVAATTFAVTRNVNLIDCDGGGNTIATITGDKPGAVHTLIFIDVNCTVDDQDDGAADTIDLQGVNTDLVSAIDVVLTLVHDGTSWLEVSRVAN